MFVGSYWRPLVIMGVICSLIATVMVYWIIESPRWLFNKGDRKATAEALKRIYEINKA